jgi:DNA mismatch repair ATPase MutS
VRLFPETFAAIERFCASGRDYLDSAITDFERDIGFYLAYLDFIAPLREAGLDFCYPQLSAGDKTIHAHEVFDLALAIKLMPEQAGIVRNDFALEDGERIFVVTGPNQGGKTTFARTFGQLHYLARLGFPVPGREATLFLSDRLLTHFEKEEKFEDRGGKLEDDLVRIRRALDEATADSIIIMNEIFSSTTLNDARFLGEKVLRKVKALDAICVYVTFVDELASLDDTIVSLVSEAIAEDDATRTFKIRRRPADGLAFAQSVARRYRLTPADIAQRLAR